MKDQAFFAAVTIIFIAIFIVVWRTGEMPTKGISLRRDKYPTMFKIASGIWLLFAAVSAWATFTVH